MCRQGVHLAILTGNIIYPVFKHDVDLLVVQLIGLSSRLLQWR